VLDRCGGDAIAQHGDEILQAGGAVAAHAGDRCGHQRHAEQIGHRLGQAIFGQQLIVQQVDHEGGDPRAILRRRVDAVGERTPRLRPAAGAPAVMGAMFGDEERRRLGQVEDLAGAVAGGHRQSHGRTAGRAGRREMIDHLVGRGDLEQGLAFMAFLPARWPCRLLARAGHPRRLLEPVARRRLAAVRTVQSQPPLKFGNARFQGRNLDRLRRHQRNQLFPRRLAARIRIRIHRILESKHDSAVEKNLHAQASTRAILPTWAVTINASLIDAQSQLYRPLR
jgi:hypothetical protein